MSLPRRLVRGALTFSAILFVLGGFGALIPREHVAMEIVDLVYTTVRANRRLLDPDVVDWEARCEWAGFEHAAVRLEQPAGYATRFELRINVEATRCS